MNPPEGESRQHDCYLPSVEAINLSAEQFLLGDELRPLGDSLNDSPVLGGGSGHMIRHLGFPSQEVRHLSLKLEQVVSVFRTDDVGDLLEQRPSHSMF